MTSLQTFNIFLAIVLFVGTPVSAVYYSFSQGYRFHWQAPKGTGPPKLICYFASWASTRPGAGQFDVEDIDPKLCTHLIYGFASLSYDSKIRSINPKNDLKENQGKGAYQRFNGLKRLNPKLKTLISIGGWNDGSLKYSYMASRRDLRSAFINSCLEFLEKHGFDGLDLAWEYPASRGGVAEDKNNFAVLLREMKEKFQKRRYLLSIAVSAKKPIIDTAYKVPEISQYVDFINVMTFDFHGAWENATGHHSALYARPDGSKEDMLLNANFSINYWISLGAPASKLVMGIASYGRTFHLATEDDNGIGAAAPQSGLKGPYTEERGSLGYNEICELLMQGKWTVFRDHHLVAPYAYSGKSWLSYDDLHSTEVKIDFAKSLNLGGVMMWSVDTDDFRGLCHRENFPLLRAANRALEEGPGTTRSPSITTASTPKVPASQKPTTTQKPWWSSTTTTSSTRITPSQKPSPTTQKIWWSSTTSKTKHSSTHTRPQTQSTTTTQKTWWPTPSSTKMLSSTSTQKTWWPISSSSQQTWWPTSSTTSKPLSTTQQTWWSSASTTQKTWWPMSSTTVTSIKTASTKPSTTTPTIKPTPKPITASPSDLSCQYPGLHAHPNYCNRFYSCVRDVENKFRVFEYRCPPQTFFDKLLKSCRWTTPDDKCNDLYI